MNVQLLPAADLTNAQIEHWSQIQAANPEMHSPFFHPFYTREAAAAFSNVEVAILEENGKPMGYLPFERSMWNVGVPVGRSLNEFQGVVARLGYTFDANTLVGGCRLSGLRFSQLLASQQPFQRHHLLQSDSPSLDLRQGFDAYCRQRREAGHTFISRTREKRRYAIRDLGPLRFEHDVQDPRLLESLIAWKSRQYARIRVVNLFTRPGIIDFLRRLLALRTAEFQGMLSAMYFGDRLAAVHLGLRSRKTLHLWFPTYNEELAKYSPGNIYFVEQTRAAGEAGIERIDLGCGNEPFKRSLRSCGTQVAEGAVGLGALSASVLRTLLYTKQCLLSSSFHGAARAVVRGIRGLFLYGVRDDSKLRKVR